jgi:hypothetical protein
MFFRTVFSVSGFLALGMTLQTAESAETKPFQGERGQIPGKIEAEHYDLGPAGVAYHDVDEQNRGADYREATQVDIEKRDDASNAHGVGWTRAGEWLVYSVTVKETATYTLQIPVASNKRGGAFHLEIDGKDVTGPLEVPDTGGWDRLERIKKNGIRLRAGNYRMKMIMDSVGPSTSTADIDCLIFQAGGS